jgi:hypothetical protein
MCHNLAIVFADGQIMLHCSDLDQEKILGINMSSNNRTSIV